MVEVVNFVGLVVILFLLISIMFSAVDMPPVALIILGLSWWFIYWCFKTYDFENCLRVLSAWLGLKKIEFGYGVNHGK